MKRLWKMITVRQKEVIDFLEKLICQVLKQITIWLDKPSCWMRMVFLLVVVIFSYSIITPFYLAHPVGASDLGTLIVALIGIYFLSRRTQTAEQSLNVERLTRAMDHLSSKDLFVRLGGISGLEQIADTHEEERMKIARIFLSFIRTQAKNSKRSEKDLIKSGCSKLEDEEEFSAYRAQRRDIEDAVNALARIALELEKEGHFREQYDKEKCDLCDLQDTDLRGLRFVGANLSNFDFSATDLSGARLAWAKFTNTRFHKVKRGGEVSSAKFIRANLDNTDFSETILNRANFSHVKATGTKFIKTYLNHAIFIGVEMFEPEFNGARLMDVNFIGAVLVEAEMDEAILKNVNFTDAHLYEIYGLRQHQLDEAFRWKGHNTFASLIDGCSLESPPEKEKPTEFESCVSSENGYKWEIYKDSAGEWRWITETPDGTIDDSSSGGYKDREDCIANARQHGMNCEPSRSNND